MTICAPWATVGEIQTTPACGKCADAAVVDPGVLADAILAASEIIYDLTFHTFPGVCEETVRYCAQPSGPGWLAQTAQEGFVSTTLVDTNAISRGWACGCSGGRPGCSCSGLSELDIGRSQIRSITSVTIDGVVLDASAYRVEDWRYLVRIDGGTWPCCSDLEFSYTYGSEPTTALKRAAMRLACEMALDWCDQPCDLPANLTNLTRQGVTVAVLGSVDMTADAPFGIRSIDAPILAFRFAQANQGAAIAGPSRSQTRRKITWP